MKGALAMHILKTVPIARQALERVGIMLDPPPPPPPPPKIEVTMDQLKEMQWKEVKEDLRDDF